jgi:hypothetical protein
MVVIRCTRRLLRRLGHKSDKDGDLPKSTTHLGDWCLNLLIVRRQHLVLGLSSLTLLPVLVGAAPYKTLMSRFADAAGQMLRALQIDEARIAAEQQAMRDCVVTTTSDRRVLGSLNDFIRMLDAYLDERSLTEVSLHLAEAPCGPLGMRSPHEATLAVFSTPTPRLVQD